MFILPRRKTMARFSAVQFFLSAAALAAICAAVPTSHPIQTCQLAGTVIKCSVVQGLPLRTTGDQVTELTIATASFTSLQSRSLSGLESLQRLTINSGTIATIGANAFSANSELTFVHITNCRISQIMQGSFQGSAITDLSLNGNQLQTVDSSVTAGLSSIRNLDLSSNGIASIGENTWQNTPQLEKLYLSNNLLHQVSTSSGWSALGQLTDLYLDDNQLFYLPAMFGEGASLQVLSMTNNHVLSMRDIDLHGLSNLQALLLSNNRIQEVDTSDFANVAGLTSLDLGNNDIQTITSTNPSYLPSLKFLTLTGNPQRTMQSIRVFCTANVVGFLPTFNMNRNLCNTETCSPVGVPNANTRIPQSSYNIGDTQWLQCNVGYKPLPNTQLFKCAFKPYHGPIIQGYLVCKVNYCHLPRIQYGKVQDAQLTYSVGQSIWQVKCQPGYDTRPGGHFKCVFGQNGAHWQGDGYCYQKKSCLDHCPAAVQCLGEDATQPICANTTCKTTAGKEVVMFIPENVPGNVSTASSYLDSHNFANFSQAQAICRSAGAELPGGFMNVCVQRLLDTVSPKLLAFVNAPNREGTEAVNSIGIPMSTAQKLAVVCQDVCLPGHTLVNGTCMKSSLPPQESH